MKFKKVFSKRILAGLVALTTVSATTSFSSVTALNSDTQYKVYRNSTGTLMKTYTLSALNDSTPANARGIIEDQGEDDDRDPLTNDPAQGIVRIVSADGDSYTGFVVGENTIATAASNVYNRTDGTFEKISTIYLHGENGIVNGTTTASQVHIPSNFIQSGLTYANYALITVNTDLSSHQVFEFGVATSDIEYVKSDVTVSGIPDMLYGATNTNIRTDTKPITKYYYQPTTTELAYLADVTDGQQGSPVYIHTSDYFGLSYTTVVAINSSGDDYNVMYDYEGEKINYGVRITDNILHFYNNNPNI